MSRYIGNYLRVPSLEPQQASAPGIWSLSEQLNYQRANLWPPARDPYYNQTVLHLSGDVAGTRETSPVTQPRTFLSDASSNNFLLSPNGDVSARPFNPYLNNYSNYFNGSSAVNFANNAGFDFSTGDFTVESWVYIAGNSALDGSNRRYANIFSVSTATMWYFALIVRGDSTTTGTGLEIYNGTTTIGVTGSILQNAWNHVAVSRSGANAYFWLNGQQMGATQSISGSWGSSATAGQVGQSPNTAGYSVPLIGYLSNVRVVKGRAVYTSAFTPSTTPLTRTSGGTNSPQGTECVLLTCQSNRLLDSNGPNVPASSPLTTTVTGTPAIAQNSPFVEYDTTSGSGYFDGTGDYLTAGSDAAFAFGTGAYTVEFWMYPSNLNLQVFLVNLTTNGLQVWYDTAQGISVGTYGSSPVITTGTGFFLASQWNHVVVTRASTSAGQAAIFINGTRRGSGTDANNYTITGPLNIGGQGASNATTGYMSSLRLIKGTAVYDPTLTFLTVPTAPLQAITNTSLLTLQTRAPANNQGILDSSPNSFVVTRTGNVAQGSFSPFSAGGYSVSTTATNTLDLPASVLAFGSSSFTVEAWVYATHVSGGPIVYPYNSGNAATSGGFSVSFGTGGVGYYAVNGATPINYSATIPLNTWYHLALVKDGTAARLYLNGQLVATGTDSTTYTTPTGGTRVGGIYNLTQTYGLVVNNLRIVTGQALYNANFTPATTNLTASVIGHQGLENTAITGTVRILTARDPYRIDRSSNNHTIGSSGSPQFLPISPFAPTQAYVASQLGGSAYFDGSDGLAISATNAFTYGTAAFTIEAWVYSTGPGATRRIYHQMNTGSNQVTLLQTSGNKLNAFINLSGTIFCDIISTNNLQAYAWNHVAFVRSGNNFALFINGIREGTATSASSAPDPGTTVYIGTLDTSEFWLGYISNLRAVKGTAIYDPTQTNFPIPITPPTAVPGTSLLLNFTGAGIIDSTGRNNLETVANSAVQTKVLKYGNGATYIPNTASTGSNKLVAPNSGGNFSFGTGDLTIEAWFYLITLPSGLTTPNNEAIFSCGSNGPILAISGNAPNTNKIVFANYGGTLTIYSTNTVSAGVWYHVAVSRASGNTRLYINGALEGSSTTVEAMNASNTITIGQDPVGNNQAFNGYIDDLRITKGYARYVPGTGDNASQMVFNGTTTLAFPIINTTAPFPLA